MNEIERFFGEARRLELFTGHGSRAKHPFLPESLGYRVFSSERIGSDITIIYLEKCVYHDHGQD